MHNHRPIVAATAVATLMMLAVGVTPVVADPPIEECDIVGTDGPDELFGTYGAEVICGLGGDDLIVGRFGGDTIYAGDGNDRVYEAGGAVAFGGAGDDRLSAWCYKDECDTVSWPNTELHGGPGDDYLAGTSVPDRLFGGPGRDTLHTCACSYDVGADELFGGAGADRLFGSYGNDLLNGGKGNDELHGDRGKDVLRGGPGRDVLIGGRGRDRLYGQRGPDELVGGPGVDHLFGNRGWDTLDARDFHSDRVDGGPGRDQGSWDRQKDRVTSVERRLR